MTAKASDTADPAPAPGWGRPAAHDREHRSGPVAEAAGSARDPDWSGDMARAQAGDRAAYRRLLLGVTPYLQMLARRTFRSPADAEDAVQDVLLTLHAIRHAYDPARPFRPWLVTIARRRFVDRLRRQGRSVAREVALLPEHETIAVAPANTYLEGWGQGVLRAAIDTLPPAQRRAVELLKLEEMSLKEAAQKSGMSVASLKVASHRAIRKLRRIITRRDEGE